MSDAFSPRVRLNVPRVPAEGDAVVIPWRTSLERVTGAWSRRGDAAFDVHTAAGGHYLISWRVPDSGGDGHWAALEDLSQR